MDPTPAEMHYLLDSSDAVMLVTLARLQSAHQMGMEPSAICARSRFLAISSATSCPERVSTSSQDPYLIPHGMAEARDRLMKMSGIHLDAEDGFTCIDETGEWFGLEGDKCSRCGHEPVKNTT